MTGHPGSPGLAGAPPACRGADRPLACGAAPGDPEPRTRTGRLPAGRAATSPPRVKGAARSRAARSALRPGPLTAPASRRPGETRSPGAGEEQRPTSRQEARTVADQAGTPTPAGTC